MAYKLEPIAGSNNRVIVKYEVIPEFKETAGGLVIPTVYKGSTEEDKRQSEGIVLAVSVKDNHGIVPVVKAGDRVVFSQYAGIRFEFDFEENIVMKESDIYARVINKK